MFERGLAPAPGRHGPALLTAMPTDSPIPIAPWLTRAWGATLNRFRPPMAPAASVYAFGKHPAFADFLDVARLPPVPAAFRHFHDRLRTAVERDGGPVLIAWRDRGESAVLWAQPSRDRVGRRCPLLLGVGGREPWATDAGAWLRGLAEELLAEADPAAVLDRIARAVSEWPAAAGTTDDAVADGPAVVIGADVWPVALSSMSAGEFGRALAASRGTHHGDTEARSGSGAGDGG